MTWLTVENFVRNQNRGATNVCLGFAGRQLLGTFKNKHVGFTHNTRHVVINAWDKNKTMNYRGLADHLPDCDE